MKIYGLIAIILTHILLPGCTKVGFNNDKYYMCLGKSDWYYYKKCLSEQDKEKFTGIISKVSDKINVSASLTDKVSDLLNRKKENLLRKEKPWVGEYVHFFFYDNKNEIRLLLTASALHPNKVYIVEFVELHNSKLAISHTMKEYELSDKELFRLLQEIVQNNEMQELKEWNYLD